MRKLAAVLGITCLLVCCSCVGYAPTPAGLKKASWPVQYPEQALERAGGLRAEAAGLRKSARECEALMEITQERLEKHQMGLDALRSQLKGLAERADSVATKKSRASNTERRALDRVLISLNLSKRAVAAKMGDEKVRMRVLRHQSGVQRSLRSTYLWQAGQREADASLLEERAAELSRQ